MKKLFLGIIITINLLFAIKYLPRFTDYYILLVIAIVFFQIVLIFIKPPSIPSRYFKIYSFGLVAILLIISIAASLYVDYEKLKIDRWLTIVHFWEAMFKGQYPYSPELYNGNKPATLFAYFLISLPFVRFVPVMSALGYIITILMLYKNDNIFSLRLLFMMPSFLFMWYEIIVGSNIYTNSLLVLLGLLFFVNNFEREKNIIIPSVYLGLVSGTRVILMLPLALLLVGYVKEFIKKRNYIKLKKLIVAAIIIAITFIAINGSFYIVFWKEINKHHPVNSIIYLFLPTYLLVFIFLITFVYIFTFSSSSLRIVFLHSGIILLAFASIYTIYRASIFSLYDTIYNSQGDITYFLFCIPFFMFYISDHYARLPR